MVRSLTQANAPKAKAAGGKRGKATVVDLTDEASATAGQPASKKGKAVPAAPAPKAEVDAFTLAFEAETQRFWTLRDDLSKIPVRRLAQRSLRTSAPGLALTAECHICAGTGLTPAHVCIGTGLTPAHICTGTAPLRLPTVRWKRMTLTDTRCPAGAAGPLRNALQLYDVRAMLELNGCSTKGGAPALLDRLRPSSLPAHGARTRRHLLAANVVARACAVRIPRGRQSAEPSGA
jgi:hypothetical protein